MIIACTKIIVMDLLVSLLTSIASIFCIVLFVEFAWLRNIVSRKNKGPGKTVPEAGGSWPIIGHLHLLAGSQVPHKLFGSMADKFGPIFTIKLGVHRVLIVSNSEVAKECLTTNDRVFASRSKAMATEVMGHNYANFAFAPSGPYWRKIRKIIVLELGSHRCLKMLEQVRVSEVKSSITDMYTIWKNKNKGPSKTVMIEMKEWFGDLTMNMIMKMMLGNQFSRGEQINKDQLRKSISRLMELMVANVPSDVFPGLRWLDIGGYEKKMKETAKEIDNVFQAWLEEHKKKMDSTQHAQGDESEDQVLMASLLSRVRELKEDLYGFSHDTIVKASCQGIIVGATDTTTITLTWALALLANNPLVFKKAQEELEIHVGRERIVEESDLKNLVYLQAIIKETMRLYPAAPLLLPHESTEDCIVSGYSVPKGTRLLVNTWKIQHDPNIWSDPFEFQPERFLTSKNDIDVKGQHYELIPFSSGRRICIGISFALQAMQLILASIIHGFEFQKPSNEKIDMTESNALTNLKVTPLELLVAPRLSPDLYQGLA